MKLNPYICLALLAGSLRPAQAAANTFANEAIGKTLLTTVHVGTDAAPKIDGVLDDAAWRRAQEVTGFAQIAPGTLPAKFPTYVRFLYDSRNLYISFRCLQPRATLKTTASADGELWNDDCIELFLNPDIKNGLLQSLFADDQHFHLIFNANGVKFDELGNRGATSWNGNWEVKTTIKDDEWNAEVRIPFSDVTHKEVAPWPFQSWSLQIGRSLAKDGERATLFTPQGLYRNHNAFGYLVFVDNPQDEETVRWNIDKGNFVKPRLATLAETVKGLKPMPGTDFGAKISDLAQRTEGLSVSFAAIAPKTYTKAVRAEFMGRVSGVETDVRSLQEQMILRQLQKQGVKTGIAVAPHAPVVDKQLVKPDFLPELNAIGQPLQVSVTTGQYQAASFVLWTEKAQKQVMVQVSDLKSESKTKSKPVTLPSKTVDVRWVKVWYQAGNNEVVRGPSILTPELLLKNPDMVTVDTKAGKNITFITPDMHERGYPADSTTLLPLKQVEARSATQVWLTINVPKGTAPGRYRGTVTVTGAGKALTKLPIDINVLDFDLAPSMMQHAWYTRSMWGSNKWGQTQKRIDAEIQNQVAHGVTHVGLIEESWELGTAVANMKKNGMKTDTLYIVGDHGDAYFPATMDPVKAEQQAAKWVAAAKAAGAKEIYLYLQDEARDEVLKSERPLADAIHRAGAKTWVACYTDYFEIAGDFIDAPVLAFHIADQTLVNKIHAIGAKVYSYANPQAGVERPEIYRRNYGLLLWQNNYDGAFDWQWYQTFGPTNKRSYNPWDDFIAPSWRQTCMVYPTVDGVVDTIQWEGWREGVTDCRYMATLLNEIARAKTEGRATPAVKTAEDWVNILKSGGEKALGDLDSVRSTMIRHIKACRSAK